jgi:hypothetical protein
MNKKEITIIFEKIKDGIDRLFNSDLYKYKGNWNFFIDFVTNNGTSTIEVSYEDETWFVLGKTINARWPDMFLGNKYWKKKYKRWQSILKLVDEWMWPEQGLKDKMNHTSVEVTRKLSEFEDY